MQTIFSTFDFYEDETAAVFAEEMIDEIKGTLDALLDRYESRHRTIVEDVVLAGNVGTWRGSFPGGKAIGQYAGKALTSFGDCDVMVRVNDDNVIEFIGAHHDGRHHMELHFITENKRRKLGLDDDTDCWGADDFERIKYDDAPVKADRLFKDVNGAA